MLKKLYKHEFYSLFRNMLPIYAAMMALAALSRLSWLIETGNDLIDSLVKFSNVLYFFSIAAVFVVGVVVTVTRFYKHLLSHEGYLTFTLPFKPTQHIICKLICGVTVTIINFLVSISSLLILGIGTEALDEIFEAIPIGLEIITKYVSAGNIVLLAFEIVLLVIVALCESLLMFYAAMALGQSFKSKVGGAVLCYFIMYSAVQFIGLIGISVTNGLFGNKIANFFSTFGAEKLSIFLLFVILYTAVLGTAYFLIARHMLTKKLNLE